MRRVRRKELLTFEINGIRKFEMKSVSPEAGDMIIYWEKAIEFSPLDLS